MGKAITVRLKRISGREGSEGSEMKKKRVLLHGSKELGTTVGVWASSHDVAYRTDIHNDGVDVRIGQIAMFGRLNPDWDDWLDTLTNRYPLQVWWTEVYVDEKETALSVLRTIMKNPTWEGLSEDGYVGPTKEQQRVPDPKEYTALREKEALEAENF